MKTKLLLTITIVLVSTNLAAQDFAPSQQAQGYLDSKNVSVDYATGLFHYKVPIYTLKSGDYELPISLNYIGKGVNVDDRPGLVGYNWSLNTGGIVTRTIRGGIADEDYWGKGYLHRGFSTSPTTAQVDSVNRRLLDGECDIFTAIFNGQSVNFIIKKERLNGRDTVLVEPLERTNIKIECEQTSIYSHVDGWKITDEDGNIYYFRQKEWSTNIIKEDAISFNGIRNQSYVSSWHINKIEPRNCAPIVFNYKVDVGQFSSGANINEVKYYSSYESIYNYGVPMQNRPFDFYRYQSRFDQEISAARSYLNGFSLEMQLNNSLYLFNGSGGFVRNPFHDIMNQNISNNFRVMGQLANLQGLGGASNQVIGILNDLYNTYSNQSSHNARMAASCFRSAKYIMIECLTEVEQMSTQRTGGGSALTMKSPILDRIICDGKTIKFEYENLSWSNSALKVKSITIEDFAKNKIASMNFTINYNYLLKQVSYADKNNAVFNKMKFDYHGESGPYDYQYDIWGYPKKSQDYPDFEFFQNADSDYAKIKSLAKITSADRGEIILDYESNRIPNKYSPTDMDIETGGIRIKILVLRDPIKSTVDTIKYIYPYPGELVFSEFYNMETVNYGGFSDQICHSRAKSKGNGFLNTGNNGIFYNYVEEEFVGKGKKTHLFFNPTRFMLPESIPYKFWLNGIPLGTATYDKNGNLKAITRNKYVIDTEPIDYFKHIQDVANVLQPANWFSASDNSTKYSKIKWQVRAYEYYMNYQQLKSYYQNQADVFLFSDGLSHYYLSPYYAIFEPNIAPRTNVILPEQRWSLNYGGKVLLKSQEEYRVEDNSLNGVSINHFTANLGAPFNKVEYFYDNIINSTAPTRINTTDSNGDVQTSVIRRVVDMDGSANGMGIIQKMKDQNILSPIVKRQNLINDKLLTETINIYETTSHDDKNYFGLTQEKLYTPLTNSTEPIIIGLDSKIYTYDQYITQYSTENNISYDYNERKYYPVSVANKSDTITLCYDHSLNAITLEAKKYGKSFISAANSFSHNYAMDENCNTYLQANDTFMLTYNFLLYFEQQNPSGYVYEYISSPRYFAIKKMVEGIATSFQNIGYSEYIEYQAILRDYTSWLGELLALSTAYLKGQFGPEVILSLPLLTEELNKSTYLALSLHNNNSVNVTSIMNSKLRLFVVSNTSSNPINCIFSHRSGIETSTITLAAKSYWNVQAVDLDLGAYNDVTSVEIVQDPSLNIAYIALVPDDCEFEATSYNSDGTVFCKFDQTGQMERYEYDGAGRVIKVFDGDGNLLKENTYNFNLSN